MFGSKRNDGEYEGPGRINQFDAERLANGDAERLANGDAVAVVVPNRPRRGGMRRSLVIGAAIAAVVIMMAVFWRQEWAAIQWLARVSWNWTTNWVPAHQHQALAIAAYIVFVFGLNWLIHRTNLRNDKYSRQQTVIQLIVFEAFLWAFLWYWSIGITPRQWFGRDVGHLDFPVWFFGGVLILGTAAMMFLVSERVEDFRKHNNFVNGFRETVNGFRETVNGTLGKAIGLGILAIVAFVLYTHYV